MDRNRRFDQDFADIRNQEHLGASSKPLYEDQIAQYLRRKNYGDPSNPDTIRLLFSVLDPPGAIRKLVSEKESRRLYFRVLKILASDFPSSVRKCYFALDEQPPESRERLRDLFRLGLADMDVDISLSNLQGGVSVANRAAEIMRRQLAVFRLANERDLKKLLNGHKIVPFLFSFVFKSLLLAVILAYLRWKLLPDLPVKLQQTLGSPSPSFAPFAPLGIVLFMALYLMFSIVYKFRVFVLMRERRRLLCRSLRELAASLGLGLGDLESLLQKLLPVGDEKLRLRFMKQLGKEKAFLDDFPG